MSNRIEFRAVIDGDTHIFDLHALRFEGAKELREWLDAGGVPDRLVCDGIFSNDILRANGTSVCAYLVKWYEQGLRWGLECYTKNKHGNIENSGLHTMQDIYRKGPEWEVVGNLHSDPELVGK